MIFLIFSLRPSAAIQLTKILDSHLKIWIVTWNWQKTCLYATKRDTPPCINNTGIDSAWSGKGLLCQLWCRVVSVICAIHSPINIMYLNCNCCSQFAYHHVIVQITVSHFVSIICCFIMKKAPLHPLLSGLGECTPLPPATCNAISDKRRCGLKISHREIVSMDHSLHYFYFFIPFLSIKNMLYCKESVSRTECWPCSIMSLFYLAGYDMLDQCCHWQWLLAHVL